MDIVWRSYLLITSGSNRVKNHKGQFEQFEANRGHVLSCIVGWRKPPDYKPSNHSATLLLYSVFAMFLKNPHFRKGISLTTGT